MAFLADWNILIESKIQESEEMKIKMTAAIIAAAAMSAALAGCSYSPTDSEVRSEFYDNSEYLNRPAANSNPASRFVMAKDIFCRVDMASVKDTATLVKLIGKPDKVTGAGASQTWEYFFTPSPYSKNVYEIKAVFVCEGDKVVSAKIDNAN